MAEDSREAKARRRRAEGDRVRAVRELLGEKQPEFARRLTAAAQQLGMPWLSYDNTIVSKLELGTRDLSIDDAGVVAAIDPQRRGKLWLGWGETEDAMTAPVLPPVAKGFRTKAQVDAARRRPGRSA